MGGRGMTMNAEDIMARIEAEPNSGCWLWVGNIGQGGYWREP